LTNENDTNESESDKETKVIAPVDTKSQSGMGFSLLPTDTLDLLALVPMYSVGGSGPLTLSAMLTRRIAGDVDVVQGAKVLLERFRPPPGGYVEPHYDTMPRDRPSFDTVQLAMQDLKAWSSRRGFELKFVRAEAYRRVPRAVARNITLLTYDKTVQDVSARLPEFSAEAPQGTDIVYTPNYQVFLYSREVLTVARRLLAIANDPSLVESLIKRPPAEAIGSITEMHNQIMHTIESNFYGASGLEGQIGRLKQVIMRHMNTKFFYGLTSSIRKVGTQDARAVNFRDIYDTYSNFVTKSYYGDFIKSERNPYILNTFNLLQLSQRYGHDDSFREALEFSSVTHLNWSDTYRTEVVSLNPSATGGFFYTKKHSEEGLDETLAASVMLNRFARGRRTDYSWAVTAKCVPKFEVYANEKRGVKERNIFATNTFFYLPLQSFISLSMKSNIKWYHKSLKEMPIRVAYKFGPTDSVADRIATLCAQDKLKNATRGSRVIASDRGDFYPYFGAWRSIVYSDNIYLFRQYSRRYVDSSNISLEESKETQIQWISLDGSTMEASQDWKIALFEILRLLQRHWGLRFVPHTFTNVEDLTSFFDRNHIDSPHYRQVKFRTLTKSKEKKVNVHPIDVFFHHLSFQLGDDQDFNLHSLITRLLARSYFSSQVTQNGWNRDEVLERSRGLDAEVLKNVTSMNDAGDFLPRTGPYISPYWIEYLITAAFYCTKTVGVLGRVKFEVPGMASGSPMTFHLNSCRMACLTYKLIERLDQSPDLFYPNEREALTNEDLPDDVKEVASSFGVTLTYELGVSGPNCPFSRSPRAGTLRADLLGFDVHVIKEGEMIYRIPVLARERLLKSTVFVKSMPDKRIPEEYRNLVSDMAMLSKYRMLYLMGGWADEGLSWLLKSLSSTLRAAVWKTSFDNWDFLLQFLEKSLMPSPDEKFFSQILNPSNISSVIYSPDVPTILDIISVFASDEMAIEIGDYAIKNYGFHVDAKEIEVKEDDDDSFLADLGGSTLKKNSDYDPLERDGLLRTIRSYRTTPSDRRKFRNLMTKFIEQLQDLDHFPVAVYGMNVTVVSDGLRYPDLLYQEKNAILRSFFSIRYKVKPEIVYDWWITDDYKLANGLHAIFRHKEPILFLLDDNDFGSQLEAALMDGTYITSQAEWFDRYIQRVEQIRLIDPGPYERRKTVFEMARVRRNRNSRKLTMAERSNVRKKKTGKKKNKTKRNIRSTKGYSKRHVESDEDYYYDDDFYNQGIPDDMLDNREVRRALAAEKYERGEDDGFDMYASE
jgi:hypothetical protein